MTFKKKICTIIIYHKRQLWIFSPCLSVLDWSMHQCLSQHWRERETEKPVWDSMARSWLLLKQLGPLRDSVKFYSLFIKCRACRTYKVGTQDKMLLILTQTSMINYCSSLLKCKPSFLFCSSQIIVIIFHSLSPKKTSWGRTKSKIWVPAVVLYTYWCPANKQTK